MKRDTNLPLGALQMVLAAFFFALMATGVQVASERLPSPIVVFARNALALLMIAPFALRGGLASLRTERLGEHILRTVSGLGSMYCFFLAIHRLKLADAVLLQYTLPLFLPLVEAAWLRERVPRRVLAPLALGFVGVIFVLRPTMGLFQGAALYGISAGLLAAVAQAGIRRMTSTEPVTRIILYFHVFSTVISAVPAAAVWTTPTAAELGVLVAVAASGTVAQVMMTRAYACAPAAQVGAFIYGSIPFAMFFDWLRLGRLPGPGSIAGAALIGGAGFMMLRVGGQRQRAEAITD
jgi:drug/metabolite transporter (DMT)-like permease